MILGPGDILASEPTEITNSKGQTRVAEARSYLSKVPRSARLKDKVCIITGIGQSEKGIGFASALAYAHAGARHLYLLDLLDEPLKECKRIIAERYPDVKVTTLKGDAADETTIKDLCARAIKEEHRLDVFFANAAVGNSSELHQITTEGWLRTMRINTLSVFLAVKYGSIAMMKTDPSVEKETSNGSIILTASVAGLRACGGPVDYSASKAAVVSTAQTTAYQLARTNIRVNAICPGLIETDMTQVVWNRAQKEKLPVPPQIRLNPLFRQGASLEIGHVAVFLASDESSYINGQAIPVCGGCSASLPFPSHL